MVLFRKVLFRKVIIHNFFFFFFYLERSLSEDVYPEGLLFRRFLSRRFIILKFGIRSLCGIKIFELMTLWDKLFGIITLGNKTFRNKKKKKPFGIITLQDINLQRAPGTLLEYTLLFDIMLQTLHCLKKMQVILSALCPLTCNSTWPQHTLQMFADHCGPRQTIPWETINQGLLQPQGELYPIQTIFNHRSRDQLLEFRTSFYETISSLFLVQGNFKHTQFSRLALTGFKLATSRTQSERRIDWANFTVSWHTYLDMWFSKWSMKLEINSSTFKDRGMGYA